MRHSKGNAWVSGNSRTYTWLFSHAFYIVQVYIPHPGLSKRHSYPIVTIEGYVWRECGPDDDEVLHSTSFWAVIKKKSNMQKLKYKK